MTRNTRICHKHMHTMLFLTVVLIVLDYVLCNGAIGNCSVKKHPEEFSVKGIKGENVTCRLYNTEACINGSLPPHLTGSDVGTPRELRVDGRLITDPSGGLSSQISMMWKAPSISITMLRGFLVELTEYNITDGNNDSRLICRIFDMSETKFTVDYQNLTVEKKMIGLRGGKNFYYRLDVFSLPRSPSSEPGTKFFSIQSSINKQHVSAKWWSTFISYDGMNFTAPADLTITFTLERERYNFTGYDVMLVSHRDINNAAESCTVLISTSYTCFNKTFPRPSVSQSEVTVSFPDVGEGDYFIQIKPVDRAQCSPCLITQTPNFVVIEAPVHLLIPAEARPAVEKYIAIGVGSGVALLLLLVMFLYLRRKTDQGKKGSSTITEISNNNPFKNDKGKSIFLLYAKDNDFHTVTVEKFALYLSNFHSYIVHHMPWLMENMNSDEKCAWMRKTMDTADYVIVINSKFAFNAFRKKTKDFISFGISHLRSRINDEGFFRKIIFVTFEYTEDKFCIKDLNPNAQYRILDQLKELLVFLSGNKYIKNDMADIEGLHTSREGIALREAMRRCKARNKSTDSDLHEGIRQRDDSISQQCLHFCPPDPTVKTASTEALEQRFVDINERYEAGKQLNTSLYDPSEVATASTGGIEIRFVDINRHYEESRNDTLSKDMGNSNSGVILQNAFAQMPNTSQTNLDYSDNGIRLPATLAHMHMANPRGQEYSDKASTWSSPTALTDLSQSTDEVMAGLNTVNQISSLTPDETTESVNRNARTIKLADVVGNQQNGIHCSKDTLLPRDSGSAYTNPAFTNDHCDFKMKPPSDIDSDMLSDDINEKFDSINLNSGAYIS